MEVEPDAAPAMAGPREQALLVPALDFREPPGSAFERKHPERLRHKPRPARWWHVLPPAAMICGLVYLLIRHFEG